MGFLDNFRNAQESGIHGDWRVLDQLEQLEEIIQLSKEKPVFIFKHSISCGTSAMVKHQLESGWNFDASTIAFYYLDLINFRPISNKVAEQFGVVHQSPQILLIKDGKAVFDTSHHMVSIAKMKQALAE